jgi:RNA polymerase-binding transcription factor DksA
MHHQRYLTIEQRETLEKLIRSQVGAGTKLETALKRLHEPDYGVCIDCGKDIGFVRLEADVSALHCQACARLPITSDSQSGNSLAVNSALRPSASERE